MRKNINKLATLVMTGALAASMSFSAFAVTTENKRIDDGNNNVTITKTVTTDAKNKTKAPYTTFTLKVTAGPTTDVELNTADGKKTFSVVKPTAEQVAAMNSAIQASVVPANFKEAKNNNNNGYTENKNTDGETIGYTSQFKLTVANSIFDAPGLYSFKLNEDDTVKYTGVTYDATDKIMYVSVVNKIVNDEVQYDANKKPILVVDSVVLAENKTNEDGTKTTTKIQEIKNDFGSDNTNDGKTHDLTITKDVKGNAGQRDYAFKINVSVKPKSGLSEAVASSSQGFTLIDKGVEVTSGLKADGKPAQVELKSGESLKIQGLTEDFEVYVSEVEAGKEGYTTKYIPDKDGKTSLTAEGKLDMNNDVTTDDTVVFTVSKDGANLTIENKRDNVTPTGVAMDIAPYALMVALAGGAAATFLRKKESFED